MNIQQELTALKKIYEALRGEGKVKSQADFADKVKYHQGPISQMLIGNKPIPFGMLVNLYNKFNVNTNYIISKGSGNMFLDDTEKVSKKDLEAVGHIKVENEKCRQENDTLKRIIADKELIIDLLKKQKS